MWKLFLYVESDVYRCQISTYKDGVGTERVKGSVTSNKNGSDERAAYYLSHLLLEPPTNYYLPELSGWQETSRPLLKMVQL